MLIEYSDDYKKITMGLLSYISDLKEPVRLEEELEWYNAEETRQLYLWKSDETDNLIGVVGVEVEDLVLLRHLSINPSHRNEGLSYKILDALQARYKDQNIASTLETASLLAKWQKKSAEKHV